MLSFITDYIGSAGPPLEGGPVRPLQALSDPRATRAWSSDALVLARRDLAHELADQAVALRHDVVLVDRLEVLLAREMKASPPSSA